MGGESELVTKQVLSKEAQKRVKDEKHVTLGEVLAGKFTQEERLRICKEINLYQQKLTDRKWLCVREKVCQGLCSGCLT